MKLIDLSLTIDNECMTCGTPWHEKIVIEPLGKIDKVGRNTSRFVLGSHSATHMDAPCHFINDKFGIDEIDLNKCVGEITCVDLTRKGHEEVVLAKDLEGIRITKRMLFVFGWYKNWKTNEYYNGFPFFSSDAIDCLIRGGMEFMAMDTPSPDDGSAIQQLDDSPNHKKLLSKDIVIVEYLTNTESIDFNKKHEIIALPLKILGADGSPSRVIVKEYE